MFYIIYDVLDTLMIQMFEKVCIIPYSIRQFLKVVYQETRQKFKIDHKEAIKIIAVFLLEEWLLKACFRELNLEGLTKQFNLKPEF